MSQACKRRHATARRHHYRVFFICLLFFSATVIPSWKGRNSCGYVWLLLQHDSSSWCVAKDCLFISKSLFSYIMENNMNS